MAEFTCPEHGVIEGIESYAIDAITERRWPLAPLWEGGPLVEDAGRLERLTIKDRVLTTDACSCRFKLSEWNMLLTKDASGVVRSVSVVPRTS